MPLHELIDPYTLLQASHTIERYKTRFASGEYSADTHTDDKKYKMDLGIRDTLYKGQNFSESNMSRGEVLGILDLMMNTKSYREGFQQKDPDRFNLYQIAYNEFINREYNDMYPSPVIPQEENPANPKE